MTAYRVDRLDDATTIISPNPNPNPHFPNSPPPPPPPPPSLLAYRMDRLDDAEDAVMEAVLMENRHPDGWLLLALICLASCNNPLASLSTVPTPAARGGPSPGPGAVVRPLRTRKEEAEQSARQAIRLLGTIVVYHPFIIHRLHPLTSTSHHLCTNSHHLSSSHQRYITPTLVAHYVTFVTHLPTSLIISHQFSSNVITYIIITPATNATLLREVGSAFVAADQLGVAEEVVRRAVAVEVATPSDNAPGPGQGKAHPHTRKLLADILGYQVIAYNVYRLTPRDLTHICTLLYTLFTSYI